MNQERMVQGCERNARISSGIAHLQVPRSKDNSEYPRFARP